MAAPEASPTSDYDRGFCHGMLTAIAVLAASVATGLLAMALGVVP